MTTHAEVCEFLEEISEVPKTIKDYFSFFKHTYNSSKPCQLVCTESFDRMPDQVVQTFVIKDIRPSTAEKVRCIEVADKRHTFLT
ncbi:hypothetical protein MEO93_26565, partial [Dolichospermum sp. ST_sed3]|nr:hypothetical protein [Dolichospermum sp. ST_sed3]